MAHEGIGVAGYNSRLAARDDGRLARASVLGEDLDFAANRERWLKDWSDVFDN